MNALLAAMVLSWDKQVKIAPSDVICFQEGELLGFLSPMGFTVMHYTQFEQYAEGFSRAN